MNETKWDEQDAIDDAEAEDFEEVKVPYTPRKWTEEEKKAFSAKMKELYASGQIQPKLHTEETKERLRQAMKGRTHSEETKARLREVLKGRDLRAEHAAKVAPVVEEVAPKPKRSRSKKAQPQAEA
jgi:outer membrane biosynthesis protein TonB